ncbi:MAG: glycosyltransferase [Chitinispirillales bacterium]|jgi:glycosyltransferase involved in cell wall biosynthesis|nr:glycosyltransferase [Chitinispirillales bacterium]
MIPKLSIITVNLNNKNGLIDTAKSVVAQTWTDYEWIIIDGGSTDGSVEVIKEYADKTDKLVYWCSEPDGGIYQGMNKGIEKASGEYCWFLNSGDYAYKNTTLAEIFANEFDEDIVYGDVEIKRMDGSFLLHRQKGKLTLPLFVYAGPAHQGILTKRKLLNRMGRYSENYKISADWGFYLKSIHKNNALCKKIPIVYSVVVSGGISNSENFEKEHKNERKQLFKEIFPNNYFFIYFFCFFSEFSFRNKSYLFRKFFAKKFFHRSID